MLQKPHLLFKKPVGSEASCDNFPFLQFSPFPEVEREGGNYNNAVGPMRLHSLPKELVHTKGKRLIKGGVCVYLSGRCYR